MTYLHTTTPKPCILIHGDLAVEISISENILSAISKQVEDGLPYKIKDHDHAVDEIIGTSLLKTYAIPTSAQIRYATTISRTLRIPMPENINISKMTCADFISDHADKFQKAMVGRW